MEWKSLLIGFILGALIAVPYGLAHSGAFDGDNRTFWKGFGPMMGMGHGMGMMGHSMMDEDMYAEMEEHMDEGNFTDMHEEMEKEMEEHMGDNWKEMHEYCERVMGIEDEEEHE